MNFNNPFSITQKMDWKYNHLIVQELLKKEAHKKNSLSKNSKNFSPNEKLCLNDYKHLLFIGKLNYISSSRKYPLGQRSSGTLRVILRCAYIFFIRYASYHPPVPFHPPHSVCFVSSFSAFSSFDQWKRATWETSFFPTYFTFFFFFWF